MTCCCRWLSNCFRQPELRCPEPAVKQLRHTTTLSNGQIRHLYRRFCLIADWKGLEAPTKLRKRNFLSMGRLQRNPLLSLIVSSMFGDKLTLDFVQFATYLSIFQANELSTKRQQIADTTEKKLRLLFNMYDTDKDGRITQADLIKITHKLFADIMETSHILNIVEILLSEMDKSNTNQILFEDFCASLAVFDMEEKLVTFIREA